MKICKRATNSLLYRLQYQFHKFTQERFGVIHVYENPNVFGKYVDGKWIISKPKPESAAYVISCRAGNVKIQFNIPVDSCREKNWVWINEYIPNRPNGYVENFIKSHTEFYVPGTHNKNALWTTEEQLIILQACVDCLKEIN